MPRRRTATALTALLPLLAGAVLAGAPVAAHAETWTHHDATGDVVTASEPEETIRPDPANRSADIRRVTVSHAAARVRVVVRLRDLQRGDQLSQVLLKMPSGDLAVAQMLRMSGRTELDVSVLSDDPASDPECEDATGSLRPGQDRVVLSVPRQCLGEPRWVRVAALHMAVSGPRDEVVSVDDGFRDDGYRGGRGQALSPRIDVG
ncbi:hypothetical protein [Nocardioides sp. 1609]|uniref:hypothetical protein n=1 Tax=Nocardioides sp. 1609 TaxID=2508327 RepID=UPI00106F6AFB|nr:hypothetical protein [Nocardioides sp. 1609]